MLNFLVHRLLRSAQEHTPCSYPWLWESYLEPQPFPDWDLCEANHHEYDIQDEHSVIFLCTHPAVSLLWVSSPNWLA